MTKQGEKKRTVYRHPLGRYEVIEVTGVNIMGDTYRIREAELTPEQDARGLLTNADKVALPQPLPDSIRSKRDVKRISDAERARICDLWRQGWSIRQIANELLRSDNTINDFLKRNGMRKPKDRALWTEKDTLHAKKLLAQGMTFRQIAVEMGRSMGTVYDNLRKKKTG